MKEEGEMGRLTEALILYIVLFFSGTAGSIINGTQKADFSIAAQIAGILLHSVPSLALIWYLILKSRRLEDWIIRPGRKDITSGFITLPCLLLIGFGTSFASSYIGGPQAQISLSSPSNVPGWIVLFVSCICAAYLEESYFRYYLLTRNDELNLSPTSALLFSTALFAICHIYEGPWGFLNAALSGAFLCFIFLRYNSLHGTAIAHGLYNILAYIVSAVFFKSS
jgi:membrane protease YdiL (CAAX protease family)